MPCHWQTIFRFHRHQKGNKHLAMIKLPILPLARIFSGLEHTVCSSRSFPLAHHSCIVPAQLSAWLDSKLIQLKNNLEAKFSSQMQFTTKLHEHLCRHKGRHSQRVGTHSPGYGLTELASLSTEPWSGQPECCSSMGDRQRFHLRKVLLTKFPYKHQ